jgi:polysaccharide deacetylase family protein (PEP-CTERM system associated)
VEPAEATVCASPVVLSFDVEEHHRIEAAVDLMVPGGQIAHYRDRMDATTRWLLDRLAAHQAKATFFIVGDITLHNPGLIRAIHRAGHEVASHSWDHQRLHRLSPEQFREDARRSKRALEDVTGEAVVGYRAPTFSVVQETAWAIDILAEEGYRYDSSIYPIRHDRYGVPKAPRTPFTVWGRQHAMLELPPLTWNVLGARLPVGGGGYFRLFPLWLMKRGIRQMDRLAEPTMLYFHPWEFDTEQQRLPLGRFNRVRTYLGVRRAPARLAALLAEQVGQRAVQVVEQLLTRRESLPSFSLLDGGPGPARIAPARAAILERG